MRVLSLITIFLFMLMKTSFAVEAIKGEFIPSVPMAELKEGDLFEATLRFWPIDNADLNEFKKLDKVSLFNAFYLAQINNLGSSANNADVVELKGIFIVQSAQTQPIYSFNYKNSLVELHVSDGKIKALANRNKDFFILDQSVNGSGLWKIILCLIFLAVIGLYWKRENLKALFLKLRPSALKKAKEHYNVLFKSAREREDFETIYKNKNEWIFLLQEKTPAHIEFFKVINLHQFKRDWSDEDHKEVKDSFDVIRGSFER